LEIVKMLVNDKIDVNEKDKFDKNALNYAVEYNN
jgi:hypothetical protein